VHRRAGKNSCFQTLPGGEGKEWNGKGGKKRGRERKDKKEGMGGRKERGEGRGLWKS